MDQQDADTSSPFFFTSPGLSPYSTSWAATDHFQRQGGSCEGPVRDPRGIFGASAITTTSTNTTSPAVWPTWGYPCGDAAARTHSFSTGPLSRATYHSGLLDPQTPVTDFDPGQDDVFSSPFGGNSPTAGMPSPKRPRFEEALTPSETPRARRPSDGTTKPRGVPQLRGPALSHSAGGEASSRGRTRSAKLRTSSRLMRKRGPRGSSTSDESLTAQERSARTSHNQVEKHYRNRLNAGFEKLLAVLPSKEGSDEYQQGSGNEGSTAIPGLGDRRISKAEVLDAATRRIKELELEQRKLERENQDLLENVNRMKGAVMGPRGL